MNNTSLKYKSTMTKTGVILLIFVGFLTVFMSVYFVLPTDLLPENVYAIVDSVIYDVAYLASFMLPVAFVPIVFSREERQSMRLAPKLSANTFAFIFIGVAFTYAFSYINSAVVTAIFGDPTVEELFTYAPVYMSDSDVILQFITIALVPAFCEEFLFRGVVLSNLMPYGKSTAVVVSAVCFGLMHGNLYQFLYTTVAGLILGVVYVVTDSIWPSTIIHMINNALSVMQTVIFERMEEDAAYTVWLAIECFVFAVGVLSFIYLLKRYKSKENAKESVFGKPINDDLSGEASGFWGHNRLDAKDAVKAFFAPTVLAFVIYAILEAFAAHWMV